MPKYLYTAKSYSGQTKGGEITAPNEQNLAQQLRGEGFLVTSIRLVEEEKNKKPEISFFNFLQRVPLKEVMVFARNLSVMISSGLTVSRAVKNLSLQTRNKRFIKILEDVNEEMQNGKTLSESLGKYPGVFNELFVNMVRVGETAGNLDEVLKIIALQLEKDNDLRSKIKGAMTYPTVVLVAMIGIGIVMLVYVLPKITSVFSDMHATLPASTQFIMNLSNMLINHGVASAIVAVVFLIGAKIFFGKPIGKKFFCFVAIHAPIFGSIVVKVNSARFARIYSSLLKSGVNSIDAMKIIGHTLTNVYYKNALNEGVEKVQKGINLSKVLAENGDLFPLLVSQIVEVGEETGKTDVVLLQLAEFYEDEIDQITKNLSSIIEPLLMIVIGCAVGFFAVAMLTPMYSIMNSIN
jgi:type IV pilus assembly protein PilC